MVGIDLVRIPRFRRTLQGPYKATLVSIVFSEAELAPFPYPFSEKAIRSLAGRFAIKEAVIKASDGRLSLADLRKIETYATPNGAIQVRVQGMKGLVFAVSLSHDGEYAVAIAVRS